MFLELKTATTSIAKDDVRPAIKHIYSDGENIMVTDGARGLFIKSNFLDKGFYRLITNRKTFIEIIGCDVPNENYPDLLRLFDSNSLKGFEQIKLTPVGLFVEKEVSYNIAILLRKMSDTHYLNIKFTRDYLQYGQFDKAYIYDDKLFLTGNNITAIIMLISSESE